MRKEPNGSPVAAGLPTAEYCPLGFVPKWWFTALLSVIPIITLICLIIGVVAGGFFWPREVLVPIVQRVDVVKHKEGEKKFNAKDWQVEISLEANFLATERLDRLLQENILGVLLIKDGQAQTVLYKQAALADKEKKYTPLKKGIAYPVPWYRFYQGVGYGLVGDSKMGLGLFVWESGTTKPPATNPGHMHAKGITLHPGKPTP